MGQKIKLRQYYQNCTCTNQIPFWKMRRIIFSSTLRYKWIILSRPKKSELLTKNDFHCIKDFAGLADHRVKINENECENLNLSSELRKLVNEWVTVIPIEIGTLGTIPKGIGKRHRRVENQRTSRHYPDYSITEKGQNIAKSPGDSGYLLSLRLQWKTIS